MQLSWLMIDVVEQAHNTRRQGYNCDIDSSRDHHWLDATFVGGDYLNELKNICKASGNDHKKKYI